MSPGPSGGRAKYGTEVHSGQSSPLLSAPAAHTISINNWLQAGWSTMSGWSRTETKVEACEHMLAQITKTNNLLLSGILSQNTDFPGLTILQINRELNTIRPEHDNLIRLLVDSCKGNILRKDDHRQERNSSWRIFLFFSWGRCVVE